MRILVVGGSGTIGRAVVAALQNDHEVLAASRNSGDLRVDITSPDSIRELYGKTGKVDAVISCAGGAAWKPLAELSDADFQKSLSNKLMGQVNLVRLGIPSVSDGAAFVVTSGLLSMEPTPGSAAVSLVNSGLEGFARAAALEMPRGIRVNAVSPPWVSETLQAMGQDGSHGLPAATVARAYLDAVLGDANGTVIDARRYA
jgi:NAD(P)-dependent dehydrogenase (short-subunit alcohol dehydrogenase family)